MQQTRLDRWLIKKFVHINRVYCNTLPEDIPWGVKVEEAPVESGGRFLYKLTTRSEKLLNQVADEMQMQNITYTSRVEERKVWYGKFINNPHKSFTFRMIWTSIGVFAFLFAVSGLPGMILDHLLADEEVMEEVAGDPQEKEAKIYHEEGFRREIDRVK